MLYNLNILQMKVFKVYAPEHSNGLMKITIFLGIGLSQHYVNAKGSVAPETMVLEFCW